MVKMNEDEFRGRMQDLMIELNESNGRKYNVFVFVFNTETANGFNFGFGCPACAAEAIQSASDAGEFQHQRIGGTHVH
jgi:hypothetical protein